MPQLTFMQKMADKASRLLPSSFSEIVEETTSEVLTSPDYENIMFICDQTNQRPDNAKDVVLAIRRRIETPNPKVQYFTVILLDALIKNCYEELHNQVADSPALQNFLIEIAVRTPVRDGEFEAKKAALQLILNMSYWFIGATEDKTKMLSKLADEVRQQTTPLAFEDIEADAAYQLKRAPPRQQARRAPNPNTAAAAGGAAAANTSRRPASANNRSGGGAQQQQQRIVDAIPVIQYTGDAISGMLDSCVLLSEMLTSAEEEKRSVIGDDIISSIAVQVRRDHRKLAILLSSGAEMENLDVLLSVSDSQTAIIQRLATLVQQQGQQLRDVANIGADEEGDDNSLHNANRPPRQQITRSSPTSAASTTVGAGVATGAAQYGSNTTSGRAARPRQGYGDEDGVEMGDSNSEASPVAGGAATTTAAPSNSNNDDMFSPTEGSGAPAVPAARKAAGATNNGNEQELEDFFGGNNNTAAAPSGDHNVATTDASAAATTAAPNTAAAPAPYQIANPAQPIPDNDFFETNNAPSANVAPDTTGSVNADATATGGVNGGEKEDFDAFLTSRMPQ